MKYYVEIDGETVEIQFVERGDKLIATVADEATEIEIDLHRVTDPSLYSLIVDNQSYEVLVERAEDSLRVLVGGALFTIRVQDEWERRLARIQRKQKVETGKVTVRAPMPGVVISVAVEPGREVAAGAALIVLSAMKMENEIRSQRAGTVVAVHVTPGQTVELNGPLVDLE
jgi:biotin carboxyl carrier protein